VNPVTYDDRIANSDSEKRNAVRWPAQWHPDHIWIRLQELGERQKEMFAL
jgi:hypothetical protein